MKHTLFAPHPDDELLGAYTLLKEKKPDVYVMEVLGRTERLKQSYALADKLGYEAELYPWPETPDAWVRLVEFVQTLEGTLWLPSPLDAHPDHRQVSSLAFFHQNVRFYSILPVGIVYTEGERYLTLDEWDRKRILFREFFPKEHAKYHELLEQAGAVEYYAPLLLPLKWERTMNVLPQWRPRSLRERVSLWLQSI